MRVFVIVFLIASGALAAGCDSSKPSKERCEAAVDNIRKIAGTDNVNLGARPEAMVRSCRAQSSKQAVECMIAATSPEDLLKCEGEVGSAYFEDEKTRREEAKEDDKGDGADDENKDAKDGAGDGDSK